MQHKKLIEMPATTREYIYMTTCDICGCNVDTTTDNYEVDTVVVSHKVGSNYPGGGSGTIVHPDICGECFDEKLLPWLKEQGVKAVEEEWDW